MKSWYLLLWWKIQLGEGQNKVAGATPFCTYWHKWFFFTMCGTSWRSFCFLKTTGLIVFVLAGYHFDIAPCFPSLRITQIKDKTFFLINFPSMPLFFLCQLIFLVILAGLSKMAFITINLGLLQYLITCGYHTHEFVWKPFIFKLYNPAL